ncbi:hypothetical protein LWI28_016861 [Acer negundo]|uniref:Dirigent protein n=1 Tax=Acer negundo TaxID=4023 RepID=A0AAD5I6G1_ACENE|nr:hypothetical protein LWI28_016861 [Acer negundo]KAK4834322.1 hypothetical protein QYF36_020802 [Acer negundo]
MARNLLILSILVLFSALTASESDQYFSKKISPSSLGLKKEKLTHLHFYFHDLITAKNPTAVQVAEAAMTNTSSTLFGAVFVMDDPLTVSPEVNSKMVGRAQGIYASASQSEIGFLMVLNFAFMEGKFNGSNLSVLGRNAIFSGVREMPIVGGSGVFRFSRGYAQAKTHTIDLQTGNAVVEYNVYVFHY